MQHIIRVLAMTASIVGGVTFAGAASAADLGEAATNPVSNLISSACRISIPPVVTTRIPGATQR